MAFDAGNAPQLGVPFVNSLFSDKRPSAVDRAQLDAFGYSAQERPAAAT